jgi:hypothetical protein
MKRPPSPDEWFLDGLARGGHTPQETLDYASRVADYEDGLRQLPDGYVPAAVEPRWISAVRRWFGR